MKDMLVVVCYGFCINYLFISFILVKLSINSFNVSCLNSSYCMDISSLSTNSCCGGKGKKIILSKLKSQLYAII